jgi:hypothetical protein
LEVLEKNKRLVFYLSSILRHEIFRRNEESRKYTY